MSTDTELAAIRAAAEGFSTQAATLVALTNQKLALLDQKVAQAGAAATAVVTAADVATVIPYDGGFLADVLDQCKTLATYAALRAYTGRAKVVRISTSGISGFFALDAADTTSVDNGGTVIVTGANKRWKRDYAGPIQLSWFEAAGTNDTVAMTNAFALGQGEYRLTPRKTYALTTPVQLPAYATLENPGKAIIGFTGQSALLPGTYNTLRDLRFSGPAGSFALRSVGAVNHLVLENPVCETCALIVSNDAAVYESMDWTGKTNIAQHWSILNPQGNSNVADGATNTAFMDLRYFSDVKITGGRAKGYTFGLMYWGGDSNFARQGALANTRKCDHLYVSGFTADDCYGAGLWGSMGQNVTFFGCNAIRATPGGDVGIDHEGTVNAVNEGCVVRNYNNGNYSAFFGVGSLSLIGCTSYQKAGKPHYRNYNDSLTPGNAGHISIQGGRYINVDGAGTALSTFDDLNGCFRSFKMRGAQLLDSGVVFNANLCGSVDIEATFELTDGTNLDVILVQLAANPNNYETYRVARCSTVFPSGTTFATTAAFVKATSKAGNNFPAFRIHENNAPSLKVQLLEQSTNAGLSGIFHVYGNTLSAITKTNAGSKPMVVARSDDNYDVYGNLLAVTTV